MIFSLCFEYKLLCNFDKVFKINKYICAIYFNMRIVYSYNLHIIYDI